MGGPSRSQHNCVPVLNVIHEAPIYVPHLYKLFMAQDGSPGIPTAIIIDLNKDPPSGVLRYRSAHLPAARRNPTQRHKILGYQR